MSLNEQVQKLTPQSQDFLHILPRLSHDFMPDVKSSTFNKTYFQVMKELDPPLDYRHMRALPNEYATIDSACTTAITSILKRLVCKIHKEAVNSSNVPIEISLRDLHRYDKTEAMVLLFWKKVEYLLEAASYAKFHRQDEVNPVQPQSKQEIVARSKFFLVHTAAASLCCPPSILYIVLSLRASQLSVLDNDGNLPLHYAAMRPIHFLQLSSSQRSQYTRYQYQDNHPYQDLPSLHNIIGENYKNGNSNPREYDDNGNGSSLVIIKNGVSTLAQESSLPLVLHHSPPQAARTYNHEYRLPLHLAIDNIIESCGSTLLADFESSTYGRSSSSSSLSPLEFYWERQMLQPLSFLKPLLKANPLALERRDGKTKLYPFMQASAKATSVLLKNSTKESEAVSNSSSSSQSPPSLYPMRIARCKDQTRETQMESQFTLFSLNVTYCLLRENPMLVNVGIPHKSQIMEPNQKEDIQTYSCNRRNSDDELELPNAKRSKM